MFVLAMDRNIIEIADHTILGRKKEKFLRLGNLKEEGSIMVPKLQCKKGSLVKLPDKTANMVRLSPSERELLSKLVEEAKDNITDMRENDPQVASKGKSDEAIADDPLSSLMREVTELLEPVEISKRKERAMSKMINNCV